MAIQKARIYDCKTAAAHIIKDNIPSIRLHKKLGFTFRKEYVNSKGFEMVELTKSL